MKEKGFRAGEVIGKLREVEVLLSQRRSFTFLNGLVVEKILLTNGRKVDKIRVREGIKGKTQQGRQDLIL